MASSQNRLKLHKELKELLGNANVYFQPPENVKIKYPCIIYSKNAPRTRSSENKTYLVFDYYEIQLIEREAETDMDAKMLDHFSMIRVGRKYVYENLYHTTYSLYY